MTTISSWILIHDRRRLKLIIHLPPYNPSNDCGMLNKTTSFHDHTSFYLFSIIHEKKKLVRNLYKFSHSTLIIRKKILYLVKRGWDKSPSLSNTLELSSKTQWLSGLYSLISSAFTALLNCAEVGRRNRILTNYRFLSLSNTLFPVYHNFLALRECGQRKLRQTVYSSTLTGTSTPDLLWQLGMA